jgi:hypothetical protein
MQGHGYLAARTDLRELVAGELHHGSSASLGIVVAASKSLTTGIGGIASEARGVLLEGVTAGAVTGCGRVD